MLPPKIAVIVPVYNAAKYIEECILSVLNQTLSADEIIVVNDGSTDNTSEILTKFSKEVTIINNSHLGVSQALNDGINRSSSDLIAFLDADDFWHKEKLERQMRFLTMQPSYEGCFTLIQQFISGELNEREKNKFDPDLIPQKVPMRQSLLCTRNFFNRVGLFDATLQNAEWIEWFSRATRAGFKFHILGEVLAYRRIALNSLSQRADYARNLSIVLKTHLDRKREEGQ